jgi:hypothetical protein
MRAARALVYLGLFAMPMLSLRVGGTGSGGITISDVFFGMAIVPLALSKRRSKLLPTTVWNIGGVLVVVAGIVASFSAVTPRSSFFVDGRMVFVLFIWQWTLRHTLADKHRLVLGLDAYISGAAVSGVVAILQSKFHLIVSFGSTVNGRAFGLTTNPNDAGATLSLGVVFAVGLVLYCGIGWRGYRAICLGLISIGLILSASVGGMGSALVGCFVLLVRHHVRPRTILVAAVAIVVIYVGGTSLLSSGPNGRNLNPIARFQQASGNGTGQNTVNPRINTDKNAWSGIVASPVVGRGLDPASGLVYYDPDLGVLYPTHNFILTLWYQGGLVFLLGALIAIAAAFRRMLGARQRNASTDMIFAGAITVLLFTMQAPAMFDRYLWLPFVLAMTCPPWRKPALADPRQQGAYSSNSRVNLERSTVMSLVIPAMTRSRAARGLPSPTRYR